MSLSEDLTENYCRVCGFLSQAGEAPWSFIEGQLYPSYELCRCCGAEHGFDDEDGGTLYRNKWINSGAPFSNKRLKPLDWNLDMAKEQIQNIPTKWL